MSLKELLADDSPELQEKLLRYAQVCGIGSDDPIWIVLIVFARAETRLTDFPEAMNVLFKTWASTLSSNIEASDKAIINRQQRAIAEAVNKLVEGANRKVAREGSRQFFQSVIPAGAVLLGMMGLGSLLGATIPPYLQGGYVQAGKLTVAQLESLHWATSDEGKRARQLMKWNAGYLDNLECQNDIQRQKPPILLKWGNRAATSGFCIIWVKPPGERKFKDSETH